MRAVVATTAVLVATWTGSAWGQSGVVVGTVYDSAAATPLAEAQVGIIGVYATGETDESGRFRIEDVPPGEYEISFYHSRLDEYGISVAAQPVVVRLGSTSEVHLAVPSLESMLEAWCTEQPGDGGAHMAGVVSNARTGRPLPGAQVEAFVEPSGSVAGQTMVSTVSGTGGEYRLCNLQSGQGVLVRAIFGSNESASTVVQGPGPRMQDISVEVTDPVAIMGTVLDHSTQQPLVGAAVSLATTGQVTYTNEEGKFAFVGVTPGDHVIETKQIGYAFRADSLSLLSNAFGLRVPLATEAIPLDPVVVTTPSRGFDLTRRRGSTTRFLGLTETEMDAIRDRVNDMAAVLRQANIPSLRITEMHGRTGFRDGLCIESRRRVRRSFDGNGNPICEQVAVFLDDMAIGDPSGFLASMLARDVASVQFIPGLEARVLYGTRGENGVLLIYTRRQ